MKWRVKHLMWILLVVALFRPEPAEARRGFAIGLGPVGNFYTVNTIPIMKPGGGGYTYFDYRFSDELAFQVGFMITVQNGRNVSSGDNGIIFLGMPTIALKYFFLRGQPRFDPYLSLGTGLYILTEGSIGNDTGGVGVGTNLGAGFDFYVNNTISLGMETVFRTIGIISDFGTPSASAAIFPFTLTGNVAFHF